MSFSDGLARAVRPRGAARGPRLVEPDAAAGAGGIVLRLAQRDFGAQQTFVGGFQDEDGTRWGRPVAAVAGPDGAVYITDDDAGAVYRLAPPGR